MVARVPRANRAAYGPAESLRLPTVGELALGERWLDALVRIEDQRGGRDRHRPLSATAWGTRGLPAWR
ncbi:MAG: hypothetical protein F4228_00760 [Acidobacteria bacterium]|nr:hypothetical protein [Acidobacteriota bacterium]MYF13218.1 hypothetical protein [Acidobacteriota bacterium]